MTGYRERGAQFSACRNYRYLLSRFWRADGPHLTWIMLNPSTADGETDDQTLGSITRKTYFWSHTPGYPQWRGLVVVNLYARVATDPLALARDAGDRIGMPTPGEWGCDEAIEATLSNAGDRVMLGWGNGPHEMSTAAWHHERVRQVVGLIERAGVQMWALELTRIGQPHHPLYRPDDSVPFRVAVDLSAPGLASAPGLPRFTRML